MIVIINNIKNQLKLILNNLKWLSESQNILAIYGNDLEKFPMRITSETKCVNCGQAIKKENLGGWVKTEASIEAFCDLPYCFPMNSQGVITE